MELEKYKYEIIYRPGKENVLPDYLSRIPGQSRTIEGSEAQSFEDGWIYRGHGVPRALLTDQAHNIDGSEVRTLCDKLGIKKQHTSPYYPQADGLAERSIGLVSRWPGV